MSKCHRGGRNLVSRTRPLKDDQKEYQSLDNGYRFPRPRNRQSNTILHITQKLTPQIISKVYDNAITLKRARRNNLLDHWMKTINKKLEATCDADQFFENFDQYVEVRHREQSDPPMTCQLVRNDTSQRSKDSYHMHPPSREEPLIGSIMKSGSPNLTYSRSSVQNVRTKTTHEVVVLPFEPGKPPKKHTAQLNSKCRQLMKIYKQKGSKKKQKQELSIFQPRLPSPSLKPIKVKECLPPARYLRWRYMDKENSVVNI